MNASKAKNAKFSAQAEQYISVLESNEDLTPAELLEIAQDLASLDLSEPFPGIEALEETS